MTTTYREYGRRHEGRIRALLEIEGREFPTTYPEFMELDGWMRAQIGTHLPLVLSDNYEHFMAVLPRRQFAGQQVLIRKQIGGFTVAAGFWKWLEFLSHQITREEVLLAADFFSGKHNNHPRQFDKNYWLHVVDDYDGWLPVKIQTVGEGAVFTGVPFPIAQVYGETPAVWLNEPLYIQSGHLTHVATIAAQFAEILGDPWRFIEVMFRALHNREESRDVVLAMLIGGGIISTSNDLAAFINGAPFKSAGTTGHCWYQQWKVFKDALRKLLQSPLGKFSTVLLDVNDHKQGFGEMMELILEEGLHPPFADRPDSGDTLALGMHDLMVLEDEGHQINVVFEDGKRPADVLLAERTRKHMGLTAARAIYGAGGSFLGPRSALEAAYKACYFHDGTVAKPTDRLDTMKICLADPMKHSHPGLVQTFFNAETGFYMVGSADEDPPAGFAPAYETLYDGLSKPGVPYFNPKYNPNTLAACEAVTEGVARSKRTRELLGPSFTLDVSPNKVMVSMTKTLRNKRKSIEDEALKSVKRT